MTPTLIQAQVVVNELVTENLLNPIGIDKTHPKFSWKLKSDDRNTYQTAYEIRVFTNSTYDENDLVWASNITVSNQSIHIKYNGNILKSSTKYYWQVRVWNQNQKVSAWSEVSWWQMGK